MPSPLPGVRRIRGCIRTMTDEANPLPFALARNRNLLFYKLSFIRVSTKLNQPGWVCHVDYTFGNMLADGSRRMTQLLVGLDSERIRLSNDWKAHVFRKAIRSVGGYVP